MLEYYNDDDRRLASMLTPVTLLDGVDCSSLTMRDEVRTTVVTLPDDEWGFLHEAAIIEYHGTLFASWYNCREKELRGVTPIRGSRSRDGGQTWSTPEIIVNDETGRILYCPPVYGIDGDTLYLLLNEMVSGDHIHALDLYRYDEVSDRFEFVWSRPIPFKLNTNVVALPDGKLMLPGRIAELDGFPNTPAVLISDSGRIDAEWRLVRIQPDGGMPDGSSLVHPELTAIVHDGAVWMFSRDDQRRVPLLWISRDNGETWSGACAHDVPFSNSKICAGTLSDSRNYLIGNLYPGRSRLAVFFSRPDTMTFDEGFLLQDGYSGELGFGGPQWSYPLACEAEGFLYVIYTVSVDPQDQSRRGAVVSAIPLAAGKR